MKQKLLYFFLLSGILLISGCDKNCTDPNASNYNSSGTCTYTGSVIFYFNTIFSSTATVNINGQSASFSGYYNSGAPSCGSSNAANFTLPTGTYSYTATTTAGSNYSGTVTITANGCVQALLQ